MSTNPFPVDDIGLDTVADLLADSGLDRIWLDLDGDEIPETMIEVDDGTDTGMSGDDLVGEPIATLLPWESDSGTDVWALPSDDWTSMDAYDPMTVPSDWTVDGYADPDSAYDIPVDGTDAPFTVDGGGFADTGGYYDSSGYTDTAGYYDSTGYYEASSTTYDAFDGYDTSADSWDTWDGSDTSVYDGGYSDPTAFTDTGSLDSGYDPTSFDSGYDPTGYDATGPDISSYDDAGGGGGEFDLDVAAENSSAWTEVANENYDAEWDLWNQSVDASINGDDMAAYDLNQMSLDANSAGDEAWTYADQSWDDPGSMDSWYDSMSYDPSISSYDSTSFDSSYSSSSYDTTSYDSTSSYSPTDDWL